jgi:predicted DNA-binding protein YlxM (UPF0122 family)
MEAIFSISAARRLSTSHAGEFLTGKRVFYFSHYFQNDYAAANIIASHKSFENASIFYLPLFNSVAK